ncbi:MAG: hypothetical protein ACXVA2_25230 [Mucilaginibacter sp.]
MIKPIKIILLLLLFTCTVKAQENIETEKFLSDIFKDKIAKEVFIYTDKTPTSFLEDVTKILRRDTLRGIPFGIGSGIVNKEYIVLSKEERDYIFKCLQEQKAKVWHDHLLPNSKLVLNDTIADVFKDQGKNWPYFNSHFGNGYHSFTQPIFLRNNSVCFFYNDYGCGWLCGSGDFAVYIKKNGVWEKVIPLYAWIS